MNEVSVRLTENLEKNFLEGIFERVSDKFGSPDRDRRVAPPVYAPPEKAAKISLIAKRNRLDETLKRTERWKKF